MILCGFPSRTEYLQYDERVFVRWNDTVNMDENTWTQYMELFGHQIKRKKRKILLVLDELQTHYRHQHVNA